MSADNLEFANFETATTALCPACELFRNRPHSGVYRFQCLECCTRLVMTAHPDKRQASALLAAIERFPLSPGRAQVLACVAQALGKRH